MLVLKSPLFLLSLKNICFPCYLQLLIIKLSTLAVLRSCKKELQLVVYQIQFGLWINRLPKVKEYILEFATFINSLKNSNYIKDII